MKLKSLLAAAILTASIAQGEESIGLYGPVQRYPELEPEEITARIEAEGQRYEQAQATFQKKKEF